jgi:hypothetical protein
MQESSVVFAKVISQTPNVRSTPAAGDNIVCVLSRGQIVSVKGAAQGAPRWAIIDHEGRDAFVARRLLAQSPDQPPLRLSDDLHQLVSDVIWSATRKYNDVAYRLGCKARANGTSKLVFSGTDIAGHPCAGSTVDCSGWVSGLFQLAAANVNARLDATIFDGRDIGRLSTHSDGQIFSIGVATGQIYSGTDIEQIEIRSGLLLGINNGDYDWEGQDRVFGIDHIVMIVREPEGGYYVTQSSSSGGGVNWVPWRAWCEGLAGRFRDFRVHCVDPFLTGSWTAPRSRGEPKSLEIDRDPLAAPAG